ncbi:MAG: serine hydrolase [Clostridia bacterium]|nr:serine hydrolase [Clostridia bacterium]
MLFEKVTPESCGIESERVLDYLEFLEDSGLSTHSLLIMKDDKILTEAYWKPFDKDFCHRMYSQTKSYTAIAVGLLAEEGKISLDDKIYDYFKDEIETEPSEYMKQQTIREMLTMTTSTTKWDYWFSSKAKDRVQNYFVYNEAKKPAGTSWYYDSAGSQILGTLVERVSKKSLFDYLYEKVFCHLGTFKNAEILKARGGDSWADSALLCTPRDMASFARFLMHGGTVDGKRIMNEAFIKEAISPLRDCNETGFEHMTAQGYGYQIWCIKDGFGFLGMGNQDTYVIPEKQLIFTITSDNQGFAASRQLILQGYRHIIAKHMKDAPLPENPEAYKKLCDYIAGLKLASVSGKKSVPFAKEVQDKEFIAEENALGFEKFSLHFDGEKGGELRYTNKTGAKVLPFSMCENCFTSFPEEGYSDGTGGEYTKGFFYKCASAAAWREEKKLQLRVRIIDRYFGNLCIILSFKNPDLVVVTASKTAEDFLHGYQGEFVAHAK